MFKRIILSIALVTLLSGTAAHAATVEESLGKIGTSIVQTVHKHPGWTSFLVATTAASILRAIAKHPKHAHDLQLFGWLGGWYLLETGTIALMQNFKIQPLQ